MRSPPVSAPASLPESTSFFGDEQVVKKAIPFQTSLKLNCQDVFVENKGSSASVSSDHVILKLSECAKLWNNVKNVQLINKSNGYNAQLFKLSAAELNSDFIQLDKGENQLEFEISLNDGQKRSQFFKINRIQ